MPLTLAAFVIDPRDPTWAEFREHYPTCPDCAGEVRAWTELHVELQSGEGEGGSHPAKELLLGTDQSCTEICFQVGYNNQSYFTRTFKSVVGLTPRQFRIQNRRGPMPPDGA